MGWVPGAVQQGVALRHSRPLELVGGGINGQMWLANTVSSGPIRWDKWWHLWMNCGQFCWQSQDHELFLFCVCHDTFKAGQLIIITHYHSNTWMDHDELNTSCFTKLCWMIPGKLSLKTWKRSLKWKGFFHCNEHESDYFLWLCTDRDFITLYMYIIYVRKIFFLLNILVIQP